MNKTIGIITGSLRKNSFSGSIADYITSHAPSGYVFKIVDISNLPLYSQDHDDIEIKEYTSFRNEIKALDGVLFITPEHNRSIPAALKNALDIGSRPYGQSVWNAKPGAVISQSPGNIGGFGANHHLRQILAFLNVLTLAQPEAYIGAYHTLIDEKGALSDEETKKFIDSFLADFVTWVEKIS
ncbi:NADPH-dependent FMN reductase [Cellulosilyticum sp. I15G10I2]|uniref:NADPH-dependent FMN reductase n=1 Tax=Cellulosilyticum sp. I15G10I2 TaxID=1892843 RepID=UPI00085BBA75|nr:NADPH-dependent FMN reductase [Cellulosilyticum sp. I15G10I2]